MGKYIGTIYTDNMCGRRAPSGDRSGSNSEHDCYAVQLGIAEARLKAATLSASHNYWYGNSWYCELMPYSSIRHST